MAANDLDSSSSRSRIKVDESQQAMLSDTIMDKDRYVDEDRCMDEEVEQLINQFDERDHKLKREKSFFYYNM